MRLFDDDGNEIPEQASAHDIAAHGWAEADGIFGARLPKGRRIWSLVTYGQGTQIKMMSLQQGDPYAQQRFVSPDTVLVLVRHEEKRS